MPITAAAYVRMSLDRTGEALGVDRQELDIRAWAKEHDLLIGQVYADNDLSATSGVRRPGFESLLADRPAQVVCWHQDRLLRVSKDLERVLDVGMIVHQVKAGTLDLATPTGRAIARTIAAWSTFEGEHRTERQRTANLQRAKAGLPRTGGRRAFGYTADGMSFLEPEISALRSGYETVLAGGSLSSIARRWNREGFTTVPGNRWVLSSVRATLLNPRNAALSTHRGEVVGPATWPAVLPEDDWRIVGTLLADPGRRTTVDNWSRRYLLPGIARCGVCASALDSPMGTGWNNKGLRRLICRKHPGHLARAAEPIETYVIESVLLRIESTEIPLESVAPPEVAEGAQLRARMDDIALAYAGGEVSLRQMVTATEALQARLNVVESAAAARGRRKVLGPLGDDARRRWESMDLDARTEVVLALVDYVVVERAGRGIKAFNAETVQIIWR